MKARVIAFYLPQYHPIPENNEWWGEGFTEWTNVAKAKPLFKGHYQPRVPKNLGFYDLRLPEVREAQAELARNAGIEGFCYWHYWFGNGRRLLERPFNEVLASGKPDFPFCLAWANHSWSNTTWDTTQSKMLPSKLIEQQYLGDKDHIEHFKTVLPAFKDQRYIKVDGAPMFIIFNPNDFKDVTRFMKLWRELAVQSGIKRIHFVGIVSNSSFREIGKNREGRIKMPTLNDAAQRYLQVLQLGFDAICSDGKTRAQILSKGLYRIVLNEIKLRLFKGSLANVYSQDQINKNLFVEEDKWDNVYPSIISNWDRSPRNASAEIYINSTPMVFKKQIISALNMISGKSEQHRILFLKSWNEWGEGNYVEPDMQYGDGYLRVLREVLLKND
jgi:hypothetical protein